MEQALNNKDNKPDGDWEDAETFRKVKPLKNLEKEWENAVNPGEEKEWEND
jgi:hypothetical protein